MKLRKSFYVAVFFSVGIALAFAEEPADENTFKETTYSDGNPIASEGTKTYPLSFYNTAENGTGDIAPFDIAEIGDGRNDYAIDYINNNEGPTPHETSNSVTPQDPLPQVNNGNTNSATATPTTSRIYDKDDSHIYDLSISFHDSITDRIGFTAQDDRGTPLFFSEVIPDTTDDSQFSDNKINSFLSFEKNVFTKAQSGTQIISKHYYIGSEKKEDVIILFSTMLAIPFALLCFALCAGFLLVIFTTMKENENA